MLQYYVSYLNKTCVVAFKVVEYLYETCLANVNTNDNDVFTPINNASSNGCIEVVKYLYEKCHAEIKEGIIKYANTSEFESKIFKASEAGKFASVQYLVERYQIPLFISNSFLRNVRFLKNVLLAPKKIKSIKGCYFSSTLF